MDIEVLYRRTLLSHPNLFIPTFSENNICALLCSWGLSQKILNSISMRLEFWPTIDSYIGEYGGKKGNQHVIKINNHYVQSTQEQFNLTVIHELRHMFWNIIDPLAARTHFDKEGFVFRCCTQVQCCRPKKFETEENDCVAAEEKHKDFIVAALVAPGEIRLY